NEANTVQAVPKKQSLTICGSEPSASSPGLKRKKNGTTKPPIASLTAQGPSEVGFTPAIAPAAKFATATGGVIADRQAKYSMKRCTCISGRWNTPRSTGA